MPRSDAEMRESVAHIDSVLERVEQLENEDAQTLALDAVQSLLDLYGEGLARMIDHIAAHCRGAAQSEIAEAFGDDEVVSHLLLLHGLHPAGQLEVTHVQPEPVLVPLRRARSTTRDDSTHTAEVGA